MQGTKLDEKAETPVAMIIVDNHSSGRAQNHDKGPYQGNKNNKNCQPEIRNGRNQNQSDGRPVSECGFCNLICPDEF